MASKYFKQALASIKPENKRFVQKNLDITEQIISILDRKGMTQRDLAKKLGKAEPEISRLLSGLHNLTLKTIAKLEVALEEDILITQIRAKEKWGTEIPVKSGRVISFKTDLISSPNTTYFSFQYKKSPSMEAYKNEVGDIRHLKTNLDLDRKKLKTVL